MISIVIHHLCTLFSHASDVGIAYAYCNFRQQREQRFECIISSLLKQLCQQQSRMPECVVEAYDRFWVQRVYPSSEKLLVMLGTVIAFY